ncbi:sphingomyelin phosphodiesterase-like [Danaus plexippus]|uniref:sphingomyelin phosphodiesterase-like n=1 Tax=Danaus plexippus TaxID=13037 RepID=UPI002AAF8B1E|nr:sphingomyelin phosphodiesterase-like [Danaus plexippus]
MKVYLVFLVLVSGLSARLISEDDLTGLFKKIIKNQASENDLSMLNDVFHIYRPTYLMKTQETHTRTTLTCLLCRSIFSAFIDMVEENQSEQNLINTITTLCSTLGVLSPKSCSGLIDLNLPIIIYIIKNTPGVASRTFCGLLFQTANNPNSCVYNDPRFEWSVDLPEPSEFMETESRQSNSKPLKIALISDAHIDPFYEPNGVADCDEPTCCRKEQTPRRLTFNYDLLETHVDKSLSNTGDTYMLNLDAATGIKSVNIVSRNNNTSPPAGYWGDYRNCDTPLWAYDDVIERIASAHKDIDVVYYIGDNIDHHVWETTFEMINGMNQYVIDKMRKEFGDNVLIVPCIGNHESQPTNQFAPSSIKGDKLNTTWLYEALVKKWDYYLTEEAKITILEKGAFTRLIKPGLRVISINSNIAYRSNWWLVYDPLEAKRHLEWLVSELYKAEIAGEKVHILSHIPPGVHDLIYTWTREYNRIINRFKKTITAEFNGHLHSDEFKIFYNGSDPVAMAWGVGSSTSYSDYNVNYKIATIDNNTFEPLNIVNYIYNLTEANLTPNRRPHWFQLYDVRGTFGIPDLSPASLDNLVYRMVTNQTQYLDLYAAFYSKLSDTRWPNCNDNCKIDNLCKTVVTVLWERSKCEELRSLYFSSKL